MKEKLQDKKRTLKAKASETFAVVKEVNALLKGISRTYVYSKWVGATSLSATRLLKYFLVGFSFEALFISSNLKESIDQVYLAVGFFMAYVIVANATRIYANFQENIFTNNLDNAMEERVINHLSTLDMARLSDPEFLELKDNAEGRGKNSVRRIFDIELGAIDNVVSLIFTFGILTIIQPFFLVLLIFPIIPRIIRAIKIDKKSRELWESQHLKRRQKRQYYTILNDGRTLVMMRLLNFGVFVRENYYKLMTELRDEQNELSRYERNSDFLLMVPGNISGILLIGLLVNQFLNDSVSVSQMFLIFGALEQFPSALFNLLNTGVKLRSRSLDYEYLQNLLNTIPMIDESEATNVVFERSPCLIASNLNFRYPRQEQFALTNCSVAFDAGDKVAIVGTNGSGKTTLARLLGKVYVPESGTVLADGTDLNSVTQSSWLSHTLYLGQQFRILELRVDVAISGQSISMSDPKRFDFAAQVAGLDEFIAPLEEGYQTQIGEQWPGGRGFSGGQMQRLALASAVYRLMDPKVHMGIFDEPMSDCDIETRGNFYRSICRGTDKKTIIVIAHDPFFLHFFKRVIVMENGSVKKDLRGEDILSYQRDLIQPDT